MRDTGGGAVSLRTRLGPGDLGEIVRLHGVLYAREHGFDETFEAYVALPLAEFVREGCAGGRLWIAERDAAIVGSIAILGGRDRAAQLRWFLVDPAVRGRGLGRRLLEEALAFCRAQGFRTVHLWTVGELTAAARLYRAAGFERTESVPARRWGREVVEERYEIELGR